MFLEDHMYQVFKEKRTNREQTGFRGIHQRLLLSFVMTLLIASGMSALATAQTEEAQPAGSATDSDVESAPVVLEGRTLFPILGITSFPAEERARQISGRIRELAVDKAFTPEKLTFVEADELTSIMYGDKRIMAVHDLDASAQGVGRALLAGIFKDRIVEAVRVYRQEHSLRNLLIKSAYALVVIILLGLLLFLVWRLASRQEAWVEKRYRARVQDLQIQSFQFVQAERLWQAVQGLVNGVRTLLTLLLILACGEYVLGLFPWTRPLADQVLALLLAPLNTVVQGVVAATPGLIFIAVFVLLLRYLLKLLRLFFAAIENGTVRFSGFEPEWSWPTYKILRLGLIAFGVVIVYPYIPGADTAAFKGVSLFLGVVFSLGSSSAISNSIAGYTLTYRRAFKVGDRVKIGDTVGDVTEIRHQVTHLRSLKNEEVIIPNSSILNSQVINYSSLARDSGLILHTTVGIGYETPWRQVEAMLLLAAERTSDLLEEPAPFVLQKALGDFCVTYELNVYTDRPEDKMSLYTALHRNILDVFNEYRIQIMTPSYVADPEEPKVVPKRQWYEAPALSEVEEPPVQETQKLP